MQTRDAAIVLGHYDTKSGLTIRQIKRLEKAVKLYEQAKVKSIITTGRAGIFNKKIPMGARMKSYLITLGVPQDVIFQETRAANTKENALNSLEIVEACGFKDIVVITSFPHIIRAKRIFLTVYPSNMKISFEISDIIAEPFVTLRDLLWEFFAWVKHLLCKFLWSRRSDES